MCARTHEPQDISALWTQIVVSFVTHCTHCSQNGKQRCQQSSSFNSLRSGTRRYFLTTCAFRGAVFNKQPPSLAPQILRATPRHATNRRVNNSKMHNTASFLKHAFINFSLTRVDRSNYFGHFPQIPFTPKQSLCHKFSV